MNQLSCAALFGWVRTSIVIFLGLSIGPAASGDILSGSFRLVATNATGTATLEIPVAAGIIDANGTWRWNRTTSLPLVNTDSGLTVATLLNADILIRTGNTSEVLANLSVLSGTTDTTFTVETPKTTFRRVPTMVALGRATASFTVTDINANNAQISAIGPLGSGAYRGFFNGGAPNGMLFAQLVAIVFAGQRGTATGTQNDPPFGFRPVGTFVDDAQIMLGFVVTQGDRGSATTRIGFPDATSRCAGDIDTDGDVDVEDLSELLSAFGEEVGSSAYNINADFDADGSVFLDDLSTLLFYFGQTCVTVPG